MQNEQTLRDEVSAQRKLLREGSLSSQEHLIAQHELSALKQELKASLCFKAKREFSRGLGLLSSLKKQLAVSTRRRGVRRRTCWPKKLTSAAQFSARATKDNSNFRLNNNC